MAPCIGSMKSWPLDPQGSPKDVVLFKQIRRYKNTWEEEPEEWNAQEEKGSFMKGPEQVNK